MKSSSLTSTSDAHWCMVITSAEIWTQLISKPMIGTCVKWCCFFLKTVMFSLWCDWTMSTEILLPCQTWCLDVWNYYFKAVIPKYQTQGDWTGQDRQTDRKTCLSRGSFIVSLVFISPSFSLSVHFLSVHPSVCVSHVIVLACLYRQQSCWFGTLADVLELISEYFDTVVCNKEKDLHIHPSHFTGAHLWREALTCCKPSC